MFFSSFSDRINTAWSCCFSRIQDRRKRRAGLLPTAVKTDQCRVQRRIRRGSDSTSQEETARPVSTARGARQFCPSAPGSCDFSQCFLTSVGRERDWERSRSRTAGPRWSAHSRHELRATFCPPLTQRCKSHHSALGLDLLSRIL